MLGKGKVRLFFPVQVSIFEPLDSKSKKVPFLDKKVMFLCVKKCACGQVLVSVRDCFLDKLPKHITPQHLIFICRYHEMYFIFVFRNTSPAHKVYCFTPPCNNDCW